MTNRLTLQGQILLGILFALVIGYSFFNFSQSFFLNDETQTTPMAPTQEMLQPVVTQTLTQAIFVPTDTSKPVFSTLEGVFMVQITMHRQSAPEIVKVTQLPQGRISALTPGENRIQLLDQQKRTIYEMSFKVEYLLGEPLKSVSEVKMFIILPKVINGKFIRVIGNQGEAVYELTDDQ